MLFRRVNSGILIDPNILTKVIKVYYLIVRKSTSK